MRLIDGDALKKEFPKDTDWEYPVNTNGYVCETIDEQPTIDAVEVVRCRDCKHYDPSDGYCEFIGDYDFDENFYCGNGERKDGEADDE